MTVLLDNMKLIRKHLNCTQTVFAEVLGLGFRTYVRYESGERDIPAGTLVRLSSLGNISLDRLLTTRLDADELKQHDSDKLSKPPETLTAIGGSLDEGRLMLKGFREDFLITVDAEEKKLLNHFRKMTPSIRDKCLADLGERASQAQTVTKPGQKPVSRKSQKKKNTSKLKKIARSIKNIN